MKFFDFFVDRAVATTLLTLGIALSGIMAFRLLPVSPLPQVDFPTISVQASLPGASPETMAATVAMPLERSLGRIAGVNEMTSQSTLGSTRITLQFELNRNIDGAARDVQAAINAARNLLPTGLPGNPTYRKANPADAPIMILSLTSDTMTLGQLYDAASSILAQKISQVEGIGQVSVGGSSLPAVRVEMNPSALHKYGIGTEDVRNAIAAANANRPKGIVEDDTHHWQIYANDQAKVAAEYLPLIVAYRNGALTTRSGKSLPKPITPENTAALFESYLKHLADLIPQKAGRLLPGIVALLDALKPRADLVLALLTGNLVRGAELKLTHYGLWDYFEFGAYSDDHFDRNELGHFARARATERHGIEFPPERIYVLGDTPHDIACARAIGAKAVAIATGQFSLAQLAEHSPDFLFDDLADVPAVVAALTL